MFRKLQSILHLPHYFSKHPSRALIELYWSVGMNDLAKGAVSVFEPIYLYSIGYSIKHIIVFYLMVYGGYVLLLPFLGRLVGKMGYEHSIFYSQFFFIAYYLTLFGTARFGFLFFISPFIFSIQKCLYWPAYHADFAVFSDKAQRGREVGGVEILSMFMFIVGPFIGGAILEWTNFSVLFIVTAGLFILSALPLMRIKEVFEPVKFSYNDVFDQLLDIRHRRNFAAYLGFGEELIVLTLWPIFIYVVIKDYFNIGAVVALATLTTSFIVLFLGRLADKYKKERIVRWGSLFYAIVWLLRVWATKAWHVFALDSTSRIAKETLIVPLVATTYNNAKKMGVLTYMVFYEQSIAVAKFVTALLLLLILQFVTTPWTVIFMVAAVFSLFYMLLKEN
jgi:MFS family permease